MRTAIETLASGMGTALLTSLVGLIASLIMKYQLVTLES
jgi:biopolymer transport protein ExbB/TolQ